jgi:hypothetical protein
MEIYSKFKETLESGKITEKLNPVWNFGKVKLAFMTSPMENTRMGYWLWAACLYLIGLWAWGDFLSWGRIDFSFHDWYEISGPQLYFLKNAVMEGIGFVGVVVFARRYKLSPVVLGILFVAAVNCQKWLEHPGTSKFYELAMVVILAWVAVINPSLTGWLTRIKHKLKLQASDIKTSN